MSVDQQVVQSLSPDPDEWPDAQLEAIRDCHTDQRLRLWASQELERRVVIKGLRMAEMQDAPDAVIQALRDHHHNPDVQAWAAEEWSQRAAKRYRDVGQNAHNTEEAAALLQAFMQAESDEAKAKAGAEYGSGIDRDIKSRRYRDAAAAFKRHTAQSVVKDFCQGAAHDLPGYRVAYETLKFYVRQEITGPQLAVMINVHLQTAPVMWQVAVKRVHGQENWTVDDGGPINGWQKLALLIQQHVSLRRFRICPACDALFYDAARAGNKKFCGEKSCKQFRKRVNKQEERRKRANQ